MNLTFGEKARLLRTRAGKSLEDVAQQLGVHFGTISKWENNEETADRMEYGHLRKMAEVYECELQDLVGQDNETGASSQ